MQATTTTRWPLGSVVAVTKLQVPGRRSALAPRGALVALLTAATDSRLTLVTGPAGAGKTTLLGQWHASEHEQRPFAWLSLDPEDADPVRFWACVIEALRAVHPGYGRASAARLRAGRAALVDVVVPLVVNEAAELGRPTVLVLDDLHVLDGADEVHHSLGFLLDRLPSTLHVAIATRSAPPLPIPRLRARGELTEVRAADLRFTDADAATLLHRGFGLMLMETQVARLQARTEGWAAGLQLAGLSLRGEGDFESFMTAFAGDRRDILDYLGSEVLGAQPPDLQAFLLRTSILERLSAPLCDAVTGGTDAAVHLDELERRNLLVVPLDGRRHWWRCHQLFAELLRHELARSVPAPELARLHRRAAVWHRDHGDPSDAIRHAVEARDTALTAELVADHWEASFNRGELTTVAQWLAGLPGDTVVRDPRLWLGRLWTAMDEGRLVDAARQLAAAQAAAAPEVRRWGVLLQALHAFKRGDLSAAAAGALAARELDHDDVFWRTVAALISGLTSYWGARPHAAHRHFADAAELAREHGNALGEAYALGYLSLVAAEAGDRDGAELRIDEVEALWARDAAIAEHFVAVAATLARSRLLVQGGSYEAAAPRLERAVTLSRRGAGRLEIIEPLLSLALVQRARGRREAARALVREARRVLEDCPDPGRLAARHTAVERELIPLADRDGDAPAGEVGPLRDPLSESELAVLRLLPSDLSQREIGQELYLSVNTVKTHCRNMYAKLRVGSRAQAIGRARELGLL